LGSEAYRRGYVAELRVAAELTSRGAIVSFPPGDSPYDLIADMCGKLRRIQVRLAERHRDSYRIRGLNGRKRPYAHDAFDLFAVMTPEGEIVWVEKDEVISATTLTDEHILRPYPDGC
jgi:hypothetical protein